MAVEGDDDPLLVGGYGGQLTSAEVSPPEGQQVGRHSLPTVSDSGRWGRLQRAEKRRSGSAGVAQREGVGPLQVF